MALLDDVKDELAAIDNDSPAAKMAQASAMMRFGGGLRPVNNQAIIRAQFDSPAAASWLERTITAYFQKEAVVREAARQTPGGVVRRYDVFVERGPPHWPCRRGCSTAACVWSRACPPIS